MRWGLSEAPPHTSDQLSIINYQLLIINENKVENIWTTANEINVSHFNIERSVDGKNFETIGKADAKNKASNEYSFYDNQLKFTNDKLMFYYRLQSVDNDGKINYSAIKTITFKQQILSESFTVSPNPTTGNIVINLVSNFNKKVTFKLSNIIGETLLQQSFQAVKGNNIYYLNKYLHVIILF